jgi:hypothetical protein
LRGRREREGRVWKERREKREKEREEGERREREKERERERERERESLFQMLLKLMLTCGKGRTSDS